MTDVKQFSPPKKLMNPTVKRYLMVTIGCFIAAFFGGRFIGANNIATGGFFGAGVVIQQLVPWLDPFWFAILLNIPVLFLCWYVLGKDFVIMATYGTIIFDIFGILINMYVPYRPTDLMLSGIIGGAGLGIGSAIVFMNGSTTGGTDNVARLFQKRFPHIKIGAMLLIVDAVVIISLMVVRRDMEIGYISIISHVVISYVIDTIIEGLDIAKVIYILSDKYEDVAKVIMENLGRGVTAMRVTGMYHAQDRTMLMCVTKVNELNDLKKLIHSADESAFVIVSEAHEVLGTESFKKLTAVSSS